MSCRPSIRRARGALCPAGFSLIELLIVVCLVGVLLLVALPGYQQQVLKARRTVAWTALQSLRARQEQFFLNHRRYAVELTSLGYTSASPILDTQGRVVADPGDGGIYSLALIDASNTSFTLGARALETQHKDANCRLLTLSSLGVRGAQPGSVPDCW